MRATISPSMVGHNSSALGTSILSPDMCEITYPPRELRLTHTWQGITPAFELMPNHPSYYDRLLPTARHHEAICPFHTSGIEVRRPSVNRPAPAPRPNRPPQYNSITSSRRTPVLHAYVSQRLANAEAKSVGGKGVRPVCTSLETLETVSGLGAYLTRLEPSHGDIACHLSSILLYVHVHVLIAWALHLRSLKYA